MTEKKDERDPFGRLLSMNFRPTVANRSHWVGNLHAFNLSSKLPEGLENIDMHKSQGLLLVLIALLGGLIGCVGGRPSGAQETVITVQNAFRSIQAGSAPVTLEAVDSTGAPLSVTWSLTYSLQPCAPECGALATLGTSVAVYMPPQLPPKYGAGTLTVKSTGDVWVGDFEIRPPVDVSISPKFEKQIAGAPAVLLTATVLNDAASAGVTWSLRAKGVDCAPACGTLTPEAGGPAFTATYLPPATAPLGADASPTISATSVTEPSESDSFSFSIFSVLSLFSGKYALLLRGYYLGASAPMAIAGSVTADGNGKITDGEFDINNDGGITHVASPVKGSYSTEVSFQGITRGRIEISSFTFPGSNIDIAFDFTLSGDGTRGRAVESDGSAFINSGTILQQDAAALSEADSPDNDKLYAFELDSDAPVGGRIVEAGRFKLAAQGITEGLVDRSQAGSPAPIYSALALSPGTASRPDSSGRGTLTIEVPAQGPLPAESVLYAYYVVNSGQLNLIEIDNGKTTGVQAGVAYAQKVPASAQATSVLQLTGMDAIPGCTSGPCIGPDVIIGVLKILGSNIFTLTFDENDLGTVVLPLRHNLRAPGSVAYDPTTGRGILSDPGGFENDHFMDSAVFYLYDSGKGFLIDADISTCVITTSPCNPPVPASGPITNNAFSGTFVPQAAGPFNQSNISGHLILGSGASAIPDIPDIESPVIADDSSGQYDALSDVDSLTSQDGNLRDYVFDGTYSIGKTGTPQQQTQDQTLGYGSATLPSFVLGQFTPPSNPTASFYMIGSNQFVLIGVQPGIYSGVSFFDPP